MKHIMSIDSDPEIDVEFAYGSSGKQIDGRSFTRGRHETSVNESLLPGKFLRQLETLIVAHFRDFDRHLSSNTRSRLAQFWFGTDRNIHYEVWVHDRTVQIELGLHFESSEARNRELFKRFDAELLYIQAALGPSIWLEDWDRGWVRIYETQPLWPLDTARVAVTAARLTEIIDVLQPILDGTTP